MAGEQKVGEVTECRPCEGVVPLWQSLGLSLKPVAKLSVIVTVPFVRGKEGSRSVSNSEVMENIRRLVTPREFLSLRISRETNIALKYVAEIEEKKELPIFISKLNGTFIRLKNFGDAVFKLNASELDVISPKNKEWENHFNTMIGSDETKRGMRPDTVFIQGLPCSWFSNYHREKVACKAKFARDREQRKRRRLRRRRKRLRGSPVSDDDEGSDSSSSSSEQEEEQRKKEQQKKILLQFQTGDYKKGGEAGNFIHTKDHVHQILRIDSANQENRRRHHSSSQSDSSSSDEPSTQKKKSMWKNTWQTVEKKKTGDAEGGDNAETSQTAEERLAKAEARKRREERRKARRQLRATPWMHMPVPDTPSEDVVRRVFETFGRISNLDIPLLTSANPAQDKDQPSGGIGVFSHEDRTGGKRTFDAYIQYDQYIGFVNAMNALRGHRLFYTDVDNKTYINTYKIDFDGTGHLSSRKIRQRKLALFKQLHRDDPQYAEYIARKESKHSRSRQDEEEGEQSASRRTRSGSLDRGRESRHQPSGRKRRSVEGGSVNHDKRIKWEKVNFRLQAGGAASSSGGRKGRQPQEPSPSPRPRLPPSHGSSRQKHSREVQEDLEDVSSESEDSTPGLESNTEIDRLLKEALKVKSSRKRKLVVLELLRRLELAKKSRAEVVAKRRAQASILVSSILQQMKECVSRSESLALQRQMRQVEAARRRQVHRERLLQAELQAREQRRRQRAERKMQQQEMAIRDKLVKKVTRKADLEDLARRDQLRSQISGKALVKSTAVREARQSVRRHGFRPDHEGQMRDREVGRTAPEIYAGYVQYMRKNQPGFVGSAVVTSFVPEETPVRSDPIRSQVIPSGAPVPKPLEAVIQSKHFETDSESSCEEGEKVSPTRRLPGGYRQRRQVSETPESDRFKMPAVPGSSSSRGDSARDAPDPPSSSFSNPDQLRTSQESRDNQNRVGSQKTLEPTDDNAQSTSVPETDDKSNVREQTRGVEKVGCIEYEDLVSSDSFSSSSSEESDEDAQESVAQQKEQDLADATNQSLEIKENQENTVPVRDSNQRSENPVEENITGAVTLQKGSDSESSGESSSDEGECTSSSSEDEDATEANRDESQEMTHQEGMSFESSREITERVEQSEKKSPPVNVSVPSKASAFYSTEPVQIRSREGSVSSSGSSGSESGSESGSGSEESDSEPEQPEIEALPKEQQIQTPIEPQQSSSNEPFASQQHSNQNPHHEGVPNNAPPSSVPDEQSQASTARPSLPPQEEAFAQAQQNPPPRTSAEKPESNCDRLTYKKDDDFGAHFKSF